MNKGLRRPPWHFYLVLFLILTFAGLPSHLGIGLPAPSINCTVEPGASCGPTDCDYTFYIDGSSYLAGKGKGGGNAYSGTVASTVYQNAINAQGAGKYCFGSGTFEFGTGQAPPAAITTIKSALNQVGLILPSQSIVQCSPSTILSSATTPTGFNDFFAMFVNKNAGTNDGQIMIKGCTISLAAPLQSGVGLAAWDDAVVFGGVHDSTVSDLVITNGSVEFYPSSTTINTANVLVNGNNYNNLIVRVVLNQQTDNTVFFQATNSTIAYSTINQLWDDGFIIASAGRNNKILGNTVNGQAVVNNKGALTAGIYLQSDGAVCANPKTSCLTDNIIQSNTVYNVTQHNSGSQTGIYTLYAQNTIISHNNVHGNAGWGIGIENNNNTNIDHNQIFLNTKDGIKLVVSVATTNYGAIITGNTIFNNGVNAQGNAGLLISTSTNEIFKNLIITDNSFYDDFASSHQANGIRLVYDGTINGLTIAENNFLRSPGNFQTGGVGTLTNFRIYGNLGYDPAGRISNFVCSGNFAPFGVSCSGTVVASTTYTVQGPDQMITSSAGTGVSITIACNGSNLISGSATITQQLIWSGCTINFGAFSVAPTVVVFAD